MEIYQYTPEKILICLNIFDSNRPKYFHQDERPIFINFLNTYPHDLYYLLKDNDRYVACGGIYEVENRIAGLSWGMVNRADQGKGYGRYLTAYRIEQLKVTFPGYRYKIETSQHTMPFYEKMGFQESHRFKDGFGLGLDKIVMWLK